MYPSNVAFGSSIVLASFPFKSVAFIFISISDLYQLFVPSIPVFSISPSSGGMLSYFTSSPFSSELYPCPSSVHAVLATDTDICG